MTVATLSQFFKISVWKLQQIFVAKLILQFNSSGLYLSLFRWLKKPRYVDRQLCGVSSWQDINFTLILLDKKKSWAKCMNWQTKWQMNRGSQPQFDIIFRTIRRWLSCVWSFIICVIGHQLYHHYLVPSLVVLDK